MRGNESKRGKKEGRQEGMLKKKIKCLFLFLRCPYSMHPICMCILYIYTYLYLSLYTYDTDLWFMPCCCPYTFVAKQCLSGWNHTVPPRASSWALGYSITMISFYGFNILEIYIEHLRMVTNIIYIYIIYTCIRYIYISDISTCWIIVNYLSFKAGLEIPMENQCFIAGKSSNCPAMPRYEGRVGNGEDHNGSNRSKLRWQGMGRNLALKIGS